MKIKRRNILFSKEKSVTKVTKWKLIVSEVNFSVSQEELTINLLMTEKGGKMKNVVFNSYESDVNDGSRKENPPQISYRKPHMELYDSSNYHKPYGYNRRYGFKVIGSDYLCPTFHDPCFPCADKSPVFGDSARPCIGLLGGGDNSGNSDPGPSSNKNKQGRRKKRKGFRGTPVMETDKQDSLLLSYSPIPLGNNFITGIGLENVCFANSVFQVLFTISSFVKHIQCTVFDGYCANVIKDLCIDMCTSDCQVNTFSYINRLILPGYIEYDMYDAHEFLIQIMNEVYPSILGDSVAENCISKVKTKKVVICSNKDLSCNHSTQKQASGNHLILDVIPTQTQYI